MGDPPPPTKSPATSRPLIEPGPLAVATVAVLLLLDLLVGIAWRDHGDDTWTTAWFGLTFGQAGALAVWTFSHRVKHRPFAVAGAVAAGGLLALATSISNDAGISLRQAPLFLTLFVAYQSIVFAGLGVIRWFANRETAQRQHPRFGVRHLLAAMIAIALAATVVRFALPDLGALIDSETLVPITSWAMISIAAGVLLLDYKPSLWRIAAFAGLGLIIGWSASALVDWDGHLAIAVAIMTVLAVALVLPQFDKYRLRITVEARDPQVSTPPPTNSS